MPLDSDLNWNLRHSPFWLSVLQTWTGVHIIRSPGSQTFGFGLELYSIGSPGSLWLQFMCVVYVHVCAYAHKLDCAGYRDKYTEIYLKEITTE